MKIEPAEIPDVVLFSPRVFADNRGIFMETWNQREFLKLGFEQKFVQDNFSNSGRHTLRGIHYQLQNPQGKLIQITNGEIFDVAVDLRRYSLTFGRWVSFRLCASSQQLLWIPPGFAHGFLALTDAAVVTYKCTDYYNPTAERCIIWNDPQLAINWPLPVGINPILSAKDQSGKRFADAEIYLAPVENHD